MPVDFSKLSTPAGGSRPTDPIELFHSLRVSDPAINDLWLAQGDALRQWQPDRQQGDIALALNTGAGKTLVGLLIAQSLVNETAGHVVYACSSIQLVRQTAEKARGYGLEVTTYYRGVFDNDLFRQGRAPCVTTYHALFNGRSRFAAEDLAAVVFDDAHTAGHLLRDQFTLRLQKDSYPALYANLSQLFRPYFSRIGQEMGYLETIEGHARGLHRFVPPFVVRQVWAEILRELRDVRLSESDETTFAWAHLRDHLDLCAVLISAQDIVFTPPVVPVGTLPYFGHGIRRVYLSATLTADDEFLRSFGRAPDLTIAPTTSVGECERMILIPARAKGASRNSGDTAIAKDVVVGRKSLVLVPSTYRKDEWSDIATSFPGDAAEQVEQFRQADPPACLVLTARYDGVDLPGDTCRMMVIDGLPTGLNPLERYLWEQLGLGKLLRTTIASRLVQSLGRISRGMSDHGVVLLTGDRLIEWLLAPKHQALLPPFIQRQLMLGIDLSGGIEAEEFSDAANQCLGRDQAWTQFYQNAMDQLEPVSIPTDDLDQVVKVSRAEAEFAEAYWKRDFQKAASALEGGLEEAFQGSRPTGAWHALWLGYCYSHLNDDERARHLYDRAHGALSKIPPFDPWVQPDEATVFSPQVLTVAAKLRRGNTAHLELPRYLDRDLASLDGSGDVARIEAALEALGEYLGLVASRPDNEVGTGPDVVWSSEDGPVLSIEAKTAKGAQSVYSKRDLGQLRDHRQWVIDKFSADQILSAFVGPLVPASPDANPDTDIVVIELDQFYQLAQRLKAALTDVCTIGLPISASSQVQAVFGERGLLWPDVLEEIESFPLRDLVVNADSE